LTEVALTYYGNASNTWRKDEMATSKLTSKFQATIPKEVRSLLGLRAGDTIVFSVTKDKHVLVRKATRFDQNYTRALKATLSEWESPYDEEDYADL
jgi:antitoxin PrlF